MQLAVFWIFAVLMLSSATLVVLLRNPVSCAMALVVTFISLAGLYFSLNAFFIGIVQILVYAGAVMVLFLFIIMLLDLREEVSRRVRVSAFLGGGLVLSGFVYVVVDVVRHMPGHAETLPALNPEFGSDIARIGFMMFERYNMPLQIIGVLLLVATIGVVVLSRKELK
jgi:NADH-quinone oxidoreductase subunit J